MPAAKAMTTTAENCILSDWKFGGWFLGRLFGWKVEVLIEQKTGKLSECGL